MIGSFYKVIHKINIPLPGKDPPMPFEARFKFLRDLTELNDSMMRLLKLLLLRSKVSRFSNLDKFPEPVINLLKKKKTMQFVVFRSNTEDQHTFVRKESSHIIQSKIQILKGFD
jgi:hypothetical protein